jgi:spermidine synthase
MRKMLMLTIVLLLVAVPIQSYGSHKPFTETIYKVNSLYQFIMVDEDPMEGQRYILVNTKKDNPQGGIYIDDPDRLLFEYTRLAFTSLVFLDSEPEEVLFVGLGAGVMPRYFNRYYPDATVDAVEIDPEMFNIAKKYFYFQEKPNMKVHILDGRMYVKRTKKKYDMIFLDAYRGEQIPFHLTTVEFLRELKGKLKEGGVIVSNILSESNNKYFWSMVKTYKEEFKSLYLFKGKDEGNFIFIAMPGDVHMENEAFLTKAMKIQSSNGMTVDLKKLPWSYSFKKYEKDSKVLTDDFAPVNLYKEMEIGR